MSLSKYLPEFLQGDDDEREADPNATIIYECRHCGTDFDEDLDHCPVCESTEIATYTFDTGAELTDDAE
ncbi:FmdB family zinc ribbon protein [Natronolimnobius baerhuensis]|uniref:Rubrerythrin-like domain-containing protein n=1 Tax=Natronolimnobius baerhuensis TaxID=253108 RepID=A0A202E807_9EURY|nr:hypothetical protein [Natronolimnobius baerhuensis]OVE84395.1 hypothetical protein B2G88_08265 [Natronolimnobius baerhuensis]